MVRWTWLGFIIYMCFPIERYRLLLFRSDYSYCYRLFEYDAQILAIISYRFHVSRVLFRSVQYF